MVQEINVELGRVGWRNEEFAMEGDVGAGVFTFVKLGNSDEEWIMRMMIMKIFFRE